ncbi:MAG: hypothetical protein ABIP06_06465 [Pyrinomonadaceae bacterium]
MRAVCLIRKEPYYRKQAFEQGLKRVGFDVVPSAAAEGPEDWLVIWNRQGQNETIADNWERTGGTVIVAENGYLQKVDKTHYAISVHGHNGSGWFPVGDEDRFSALGFPLQPPKTNVDGHWLICGQRGVGSREMRSPPGWGEALASKFKRAGLRYKLRQHPGQLPPRVPLLDDLKGALAVAIWSSAAGVRALVEGYEVRHHAPHWICEGPEREAALHRMSHNQWHHDEIATGEPFARIIEHRKEAKW